MLYHLFVHEKVTIRLQYIRTKDAEKLYNIDSVSGIVKIHFGRRKERGFTIK